MKIPFKPVKVNVKSIKKIFNKGIRKRDRQVKEESLDTLKANILKKEPVSAVIKSEPISPVRKKRFPAKIEIKIEESLCTFRKTLEN